VSYDHDNLVSCCGEKLALSVVGSNSDTSRNRCILLLPGGGEELGKERFRYMQERLAKQGYFSASFDFSGVGASTGDLEKSSLEDRTEQAICVTQFLRNRFSQKEFVLYGVSMGGYIALSVTDRIPGQFEKLVLHAPAAYAEEAHSLNFNERFTKELRQDASWQSSQSFRWLANYPHQALILFGLEDGVIPRSIISRYKSIGADDKKTEFVSITDMKHNTWEGENTQHYQDIILDNIVNFIRKKDTN
jgi:pimeloyl-ACP methyl ester carboxylesterase